jgi:hypothetical protein
MRLSKRDTKFFLRLCVLLISSLTLGLAVRVVFSSSEIEKLVAQSLLRDTLLFAAPITSLAVLHYTLAVKSFGLRDAWIEIKAFTGFAMIFASIVAPAVFGGWVATPPADCPWYKKCPDEMLWDPNLYVASALGGIGIALLLSVVWNQLRSKPSHSSIVDTA